MPRRDGTGPDGQGSRTGRGMGNCTPDNNTPQEEQNMGIGRRIANGVGRMFQGNGGGRGKGNRGGGRRNR